jgi:hypothetical protein
MKLDLQEIFADAKISKTSPSTPKLSSIDKQETLVGFFAPGIAPSNSSKRDFQGFRGPAAGGFGHASAFDYFKRRPKRGGVAR